MLPTLLFWLNIKMVLGDVNGINCGTRNNLHACVIICQKYVWVRPRAQEKEQS